ncbi:DUF4163 domain-containing protein [Allomuricauda sp. d1]|uniref:DUF3298 and DUF4163 domain-containing protein n=1 Tax=Allomuricauda sp. d1 TaxID=3136725 RepID=UPI0031D8C936
MKKITFCLLLLLAIGCEKKEKLTFETMTLTNEGCSDCPAMVIKIPKVLSENKVAQTINTALREEIIYSLSFEDENDASDIEGAMDSFTAEYHKMKSEFPDMASLSEWEAEIKAEVIYEDKSLVTIQLNGYTYTGGAHGYGYTTYLNFDKDKGEELDNWQLFKDLEGFTTLAETKFRSEQDIPKNGDINTTGFMFEKNQFHLADNIGFTPEGLQMVYNQYEVASYADGPILLTISFDEANPFLKKTFQPKL